jgi:hypothetical protein
MKRIHRSRNFVCEIEQAGKRFLLLDIERSDAEWRNLTYKTDGYFCDGINRDSSEDFPGLTGVGCRSDSPSTVFFFRLSRRPRNRLDWERILMSGRIQALFSPLDDQTASTPFPAAQAMQRLFRRDWVHHNKQIYPHLHSQQVSFPVARAQGLLHMS